MDDIKLLEFAAKAAGIEYNLHYGCGDALRLTSKSANALYWNPLKDDAQALRLVVKLELLLDMTAGGYCAYLCPINKAYYPVCEENTGDLYAATRRAIVRAAAEIGKQI